MPAKFHSFFTIDDIHFTVISSSTGIREIIFNVEKNSSKLLNTIQLKPEDPDMLNVYPQIKEFFSGKRKHFDLPLEIEGTEFQKRVWNELSNIPYGRTICYKELAVRLGD